MYKGRRPAVGLKPKDLIGIPWRVALALQADGWYLRSDVIWSKPNPMPESVTDRPTRAHEYIFVLTKRSAYFWDQEAVREAPSPTTHGNRRMFRGGGSYTGGNSFHNDRVRPNVIPGNSADPVTSRNLRTVWTIATQPYAGAHFATFPEALVERCILAGTSPQACEVCGAPWARVVERDKHPERDVEAQRAYYAARTGRADGHIAGPGGMVDTVITTGWAPTCRCPDTTGSAACTVLDPFAGSGTVLRVAIKHNRSAIGIDLSPDYADLQLKRTDGVQRRLL